MNETYSRPNSIEELKATYTKAAGRVIFTEDIGEIRALENCLSVDTQDINTSFVSKQTGEFVIGGTTTLENILRTSEIHDSIKKTITAEFGLNKRNRHTIGTILRSCSGNSLFMTLLVALDIRITTAFDMKAHTAGEWIDRQDKQHIFIKDVVIPEIKIADIKWVSKTPASLPEISLALARWAGGRTRIVLGGITNVPELLVDGPITKNIINNLDNACSQYINNNKFKEYNKMIIQVFMGRLIDDYRLLEVSK